MDQLYPSGPTAVPSDFAKPSVRYWLHAWLAVTGLFLFIGLYVALAAWFTWTAYRLLAHGIPHADVATVLSGLITAFASVLLWKAMRLVPRPSQLDAIEVTAREQPKLFHFLERLAADAGTQPPHRVFLSPRVNSAVFYDYDARHRFFPSRRNLEIGLALVNVLSVGELKAVLAHELGHLAQHSMLVGRWVCLAQQIATHLVSQRDALDRLIDKLQHCGTRFASASWPLSVLAWAVRAITESVFRLVMLAQRALSREMELQADLVAVSLTGSDALVHALHRLHAAEQTWSRTLDFANGEAHAGRSVADLFALQQRIMSKLRQILDDTNYGDTPTPARASAYRLFTQQLTQSPRKWSTHPANWEREENAKQNYIRARIDGRSAWHLFDASGELKLRMSKHVFRHTQTRIMPLEESCQRLDQQYNRYYYHSAYRGAYLGRSVVRQACHPSELYNPPLRPDLITPHLTGLYPESLADNLQRLRALDQESSALRGLQASGTEGRGGTIYYRGNRLRRKDLPAVIAQVERELAAAREVVLHHDRRCRTAHLSAAATLGAGWDAYLLGLAKALHYADHAEANVRDAHGMLSSRLEALAADQRLRYQEFEGLMQACRELHEALRHVFVIEGPALLLDRTLNERLSISSWQDTLGDFRIPAPQGDNVDHWLQIIDGWVEGTCSALASLRLASLEQLLIAEAHVARLVHEKRSAEPAPMPTVVPAKYPLLLPGKERPRHTKLHWRQRFHAANGFLPALTRLCVATGILVAVMLVSMAGLQGH
jgi:Zn-dependent protease with chaperone function